jgi:uncharacterized membrane protein
LGNKFVQTFIRYFLRGLLFTAPIFVTFYIILACLNWLDSLIAIDIPGLGLLIIISSITLLGILASTVLAKPMLDFFIYILEHIPVVNTIYTSLKDVVNAFVGDNKKFKSAVFITLEKDLKIKRIGFITETDLSKFNQEGMIAVYVPDSYGVTGNLYIVSAENVEEIHLPVAEVMKFVLSGGIAKPH